MFQRAERFDQCAGGFDPASVEFRFVGVGPVVVEGGPGQVDDCVAPGERGGQNAAFRRGEKFSAQRDDIISALFHVGRYVAPDKSGGSADRYPHDASLLSTLFRISWAIRLNVRVIVVSIRQ
nr:hypothetical protein [Millionella massiliensis]